MKIDLETLEEASRIVFSHLREEGIKDIEIDEDFYWNIPKDQRYNPYKDPKEFDMGQLSDDFSEVKKIASGNSRPIGYALVWLASLYRRIGEKSSV